MFIDTTELTLKAGKGGDGRASFRRVKYNAYGGPDGGDGGRGGNIILRAEHNLDTLSAYRTKRRMQAENGEAGKSGKSRGKNGKDVVVPVPVGTVVMEGEAQIADLAEDGQEFVAAHGGRGGYGNAHFTTSVRQAPDFAELGEPGEEKLIRLELRLVADIGLVGLPNAGKSTFLSVVSNAKPKVADYAFTTLVPNLGIAEIDGTGMVIADIPGLIEGASQGKGLGDEFLRHVTRTAILLHLVDITSENPVQDYHTIEQELAAYSQELAQKPRIIALNKTDAAGHLDISALQQKLKAESKREVVCMSAAAGEGVKDVLRKVRPLVEEARAQRVKEKEEKVPEYSEVSDPRVWHVEQTDEGWRVHGEKIEGFARRTNFDQPEAVERLRDIMKKMGIIRELERRGAQPEDKVMIIDKVLKL